MSEVVENIYRDDPCGNLRRDIDELEKMLCVVFSTLEEYGQEGILDKIPDEKERVRVARWWAASRLEYFGQLEREKLQLENFAREALAKLSLEEVAAIRKAFPHVWR